MKLFFFNLFLAISCKPLSNVDCPEICPRILSPVCGSDGVTYGNKCEFRRARCASSSGEKLKIVKNGACNSKKSGLRSTRPKTNLQECPLFCHRMYQPVCGSDDVTYSNECVLQRESCNQPWLNLKMKHSGSCQLNSNEFMNFLIEQEQIEQQMTSLPPRVAKIPLRKSGINCPSFCSRIYQPVCGSDNQTYGNKCVLERLACENPSLNLKIRNVGACEADDAEVTEIEEPECPLFCHRMLQPVCGSDNETYGNECTLKQQACNQPSMNLFMKYDGPCDSGNHQNNEFQGEELSNKPQISLKIAKSDCPRFCNRMYRPVCGSNNETYANECVLEMHSCENPSLNLYKKSLGEC